jgi:phage gp36-like protein
MGNYITSAQARAHLRSDFDQLYTLPDDDAELAQDIAAAEAVCDSYIGRRYQVPISGSGTGTGLVFVRTLALDLFAEAAYTLRAHGEEIPKKIAERAKTARHQLEQIAAGAITLGGEMPAEADGAGADAYVVQVDDPLYTAEQMKGF